MRHSLGTVVLCGPILPIPDDEVHDG